MRLRRITSWSTIVILLMSLGVMIEMAWPQSLLGNKVEAFYDGQWNNISADVRGVGAEDGEINIGARGMPDESSGLVTTIANLSLNNRLGKYSPRNVRSPLYGKLGPNTPLRISTDVSDTHSVFDSFDIPGINGWPNSDSGHAYTTNGGAAADYFVAGGKAYQQHTATNTTHRSILNDLVISDFDAQLRGVTVEAVPTGSTTVVAGVRGRHTSNTTFIDGQMLFTTANTVLVQVRQVVNNVSTISSAQVAVPAVTALTPMTMRVQAVGRTIRAKAWASSGSEPAAWMVSVTDLTNITPGVMAVASALGSGITNALPFDVTFGSIDFSLGIILFTGEVTEWPKRWDTTGNDVWVPLTASGITRRLIQGAKPLRSALYRALSRTDLIGYWDFESLTGIDYPQIPSALPNGAPLNRILTGAGDNRTTWNINTSLPGSGGLPVNELASGSGFLSYGNALLTPTPDTNNAFSIVYFHQTPLRTDVAAEFASYGAQVSMVNTSNVVTWTTRIIQTHSGPGLNSVSFSVIGLNSAGAILINPVFASQEYTTDWRMARITIDQSGGNLRLRVYLDEVLILTDTSLGVATTGQPERVLTATASASASGLLNSWGHLAVASGLGTDPLATNAAFIRDASLGHNRESAIDRMTRIFAEQGVTLEITQGSVDEGEGTLLGIQKTKTFVELAVDTVNADDGLLFELRDQLGYGFRTRASLYATPSRLTIDYANAELSEVPETTDDDQRIRNEITAVRADSNTSVTISQTTGPMSTNEPSDSSPGVGRYNTEVRPAVYADDQLLDYAGLRLMLGTWDESRWPVISVGLHRAPFANNLTQLTSAAFLDIADIFTLVNLPEWLPPDDVILQMRSVSVFLSNFNWGIDWNALPGGPWAEIGRVGDGSFGRLDTEGTVLVTGVADTETSLVLLSDYTDLPFDTPLWTEDINELNYYDEAGLRLRMNPPTRAGGRGGEQISIGSTYPVIDTFSRVAAQLAGTNADTGQTWAQLTGVATDITVNGTEALFTQPAVGSALVELPVGNRDMCVSVNFKFSVTTATGGDIHADIVVRQPPGSFADSYRVRATLLTGTDNVQVTLRKNIGGVGSQIGQAFAATSINNTTVAWRAKIMIRNRDIWAKVWRTAATDPPEPDWQVGGINLANQYLTGTSMALRVERAAGNTDVNARVIYDNLQVQTPKINPIWFDHFDRTSVDSLGFDDSGAGGWWTSQAGGTIVDYDVAPYRATTVITGASQYRGAYLGSAPILTNACVRLIWTCPLATGASLEPGGIMLRQTGVSTGILFRVNVTTAAAITMEIYAASGALLGSTTAWGLTHVAATEYHTKAAVMGTQVMMKVWVVGTPEPHYWHLVATDVSPIVAGWVGWRNGRAAGNTNVNPTPTIADFRVENPQRITAERGTNGVAVDWAVNTDIRLWNPLRLGR